MQIDKFWKKYHPCLQTFGRVQYYRLEMQPFLPDELKFGFRMPTAYAASTPKATYRNDIEGETIRFLTENLKVNYFNPEKGFTLDLKLGECELLFGSKTAFKEVAESGELDRIHADCVKYEKLLTE